MRQHCWQSAGHSSRRRGGFTLIELMIAVVVVAILAAIAVPAYQQMVRKGRRADAVAMLTRLQQLQERYRSNNASYAAALTDLGTNVANTSDKGYYQATISNAGATGYTLTASVVSGTPQASDTDCASLWVTQSAGNLTYGGTTATCWAQ